MKKYLDSIDEAVKISVQGLKDIEIDKYNDDGCNGYVFFGNHKVFRCRVAIKYYYYGENAHEEVSLIKHISNKYVLKVWDAHTIDNGWAYFITDEQSNGSLDNLIQNTNIDTETGLNIIRGILNGVGDLHARPNYLLHRDLKPANILISNNMSPIIADFGSIKRVPQGSDFVKASKHSALYRPPEAYEKKEYTYSSDIYQIGMLLYQVMGGELSYDATAYMTKQQLKEYKMLSSGYEKSIFEDKCLFEKCKRETLLDYKSLPAYVDKKIIQIMKKATKYNYKERFNNIADFQLALHNIGGLPNWGKKDGILCCQYNSVEYRVLNNTKGKYVVERFSKGKWSKVRGSEFFENEKLAIIWLKENI